jgi:hypothetical protein
VSKASNRKEVQKFERNLSAAAAGHQSLENRPWDIHLGKLGYVATDDD